MDFLVSDFPLKSQDNKMSTLAQNKGAYTLLCINYSIKIVLNGAEVIDGIIKN